MASFSYCFRCGAPTARRVIEGRERDYCEPCARPLYENAKPCVGVLVEDAGRLLLLERGIEPYKGLWDIPGGFLEAEEHPEVGARREVLEETGLDVALDGLVGVEMDRYAPNGDEAAGHYNLVLYYAGRVVGGTLRASHESTGARWFSRAELPPTEAIAFESAQRMARLWQSRG